MEQQPGRHGQSASPKIADLGLPQADRVEQAEVQHPHLATAMAGSVPETTSQDAQQARVLNNAGSEGPSVNHLGRRVGDVWLIVSCDLELTLFPRR